MDKSVQTAPVPAPRLRRIAHLLALSEDDRLLLCRVPAAAGWAPPSCTLRPGLSSARAADRVARAGGYGAVLRGASGDMFQL